MHGRATFSFPPCEIGGNFTVCEIVKLTPKLWVWVAEVSWGQHKWDKEAGWGGGVRIWLWTFLVEIPPLQLPTQLKISGYHSLPDPRLLLSFLAEIARKHACRNHNSWISRQTINWGNDWAASGIDRLVWPIPLCCPQSWPAASLLTPGPFWVEWLSWLMKLRSRVEKQVEAEEWGCLSFLGVNCWCFSNGRLCSKELIKSAFLSMHSITRNTFFFFKLSLLKYNLCTVKCVLCRCSVLCVLTNTQSSGLSERLSGKEPVCLCRRLRRPWFDPWVQKIPWSRKWQPIPVFLAGKSQGRGAWQVTLHVLQRVWHDWVTDERTRVVGECGVSF